MATAAAAATTPTPTTTTPATTTTTNTTTLEANNTNILSTPDFAYLSWAFTNLEFNQTHDKHTMDLIKSANSLETDENKRLDSLQKLTEILLNEMKSETCMSREVISKLTTMLFELLLDPSPDLRLDAFVALIYTAIVKRKHNEPGFHEMLRERTMLNKCGKTVLSALDLALVFEMALDVYCNEEREDCDLDSFYQAFREYTSSGRHFLV